MDLASTFDSYYKPLYRYLVRLCGDVELAADAAQEAFLRLAERPPTNYQNVKAWLYTVGGNYIRDALKVVKKVFSIRAWGREKIHRGAVAQEAGNLCYLQNPAHNMRPPFKRA